MSYNYFELRNVKHNYYNNFTLPHYLLTVLPKSKSSKILDIGCGLGQYLMALKNLGYNNLEGIDTSKEAIDWCKNNNLNVHLIDLKDYSGSDFDLIIMGHVLEHCKKDSIISLLSKVKNMLSDNGYLIITVPNAQSNTGCYWAYEDFTHNTIFTAGSLYFVLKSASFTTVEFLDPDGLENVRAFFRWPLKILLLIYKTRINFWNKVTRSYFHRPSPQIFTYEVKVLAK